MLLRPVGGDVAVCQPPLQKFDVMPTAVQQQADDAAAVRHVETIEPCAFHQVQQRVKPGLGNSCWLAMALMVAASPSSCGLPQWQAC